MLSISNLMSAIMCVHFKTLNCYLPCNLLTLKSKPWFLNFIDIDFQNLDKYFLKNSSYSASVFTTKSLNEQELHAHTSNGDGEVAKARIQNCEGEGEIIVSLLCLCTVAILVLQIALRRRVLTLSLLRLKFAISHLRLI